MGSFVELNDTLQITAEQGFPAVELDLKKHQNKPYKAGDFKGRVFEFSGKHGARVYHPAPNRCFLVHNINGKWLYWGKIEMIEQTIHSEAKSGAIIQTTSGKYRIIEIYPPKYQEEITLHESPEGKSFF